MLSQHLIERALSLTGKTMDDISVTEIDELDQEVTFMSIEKFCYYLLSPGFLLEYHKIDNTTYTPYGIMLQFGAAIYEYQIGNEEPLVELLTKI